MAFALLIGGLIILGAGYLEHWPFWKSAVEHLGTAIFIAAVLGLTIHVWLEKQITEDVFTAAMGYELPSELREEIRFVYGSRIICEEHTQTVRIDKLDENLVSVTVGLERTFRNIAQTKEELNIALAVDEWGIEGHPSKIIEVAYQYDNKAKLVLYPSGTATLQDRPEGPAVKAPSPVSLAPDQTLTLFTSYSETKSLSDEHFATFLYATRNPRVTVRAPGFKWGVGFAHRGEPQVGHYSDTTILKGVLLPNQNIRIRWWPEARGTAPAANWREPHPLASE
jgi:hypothetical protein